MMKRNTERIQIQAILDQLSDEGRAHHDAAGALPRRVFDSEQPPKGDER